jgi:hypothetical protein
LSKFVLEILVGNFAREAPSKSSQREILEEVLSKCLAKCLIGYGQFKVEISLKARNG